LIQKCYNTHSDQLTDQLTKLDAIMNKQETATSIKEELFQELRKFQQTTETQCCPQLVTQHPHSIDVSVMFNPSITPNISFGSSQDFQHNGCRQVLA